VTCAADLKEDSVLSFKLDLFVVETPRQIHRAIHLDQQFVNPATALLSETEVGTGRGVVVSATASSTTCVAVAESCDSGESDLRTSFKTLVSVFIVTQRHAIFFGHARMSVAFARFRYRARKPGALCLVGRSFIAPANMPKAFPRRPSFEIAIQSSINS
jgi:hypothetical protein